MNLHYKEYGQEGQVILIVHGIFGSLDNWHTVAKQLGERYHVFTLDMRNHGYSPHSDEMSLSLMAEDIKEFIRNKNLENICLLGHSMGGKVAMKFTESNPNLLEKLIVVDIAPKSYKAGHQPYFRAYREIDLTVIESRKALDEAFTKYEKNFGVRQFLMKNIVSKEGGYKLKINIDGIERGYNEIVGSINLEQIDLPTLFIAGAKSNYIQEEDYKSINGIFSNVHFNEIPHAGHWVHAENKEDFVEAVIQFMNE